MKKEIFKDETRLKHLEGLLPVAAERVTAAGDAIKKNFPAIAWNTQALWVLAIEPGARNYLCRQILQRAADLAGLICKWEIEDTQAPKVNNVILKDEKERPQPITEEIRLNRKLVELQTKDTRAPILALDGSANLDIFLRTGALYIDKKGQTQTAPERLEDFCTLYAESKAQAAFVAALENMRKAAQDMSAAYIATLAFVPKAARPEMSANAGFYMPTLGALDKAGNLRLNDDTTPARALIAFFDLAGKTQGEPKYYNFAGLWAYTPKEANALIGCNLESLKMRELYPALYGPTTAKTQQVSVPASDNLIML